MTRRCRSPWPQPPGCSRPGSAGGTRRRWSWRASKAADLPELALPDWEGSLAAAWRRRWPELAAARWHPAMGDGAAANLGVGCDVPSRAAMTIGTSAAVRSVRHRRGAGLPPLPAGPLALLRRPPADGHRRGLQQRRASSTRGRCPCGKGRSQRQCRRRPGPSATVAPATVPSAKVPVTGERRRGRCPHQGGEVRRRRPGRARERRRPGPALARRYPASGATGPGRPGRRGRPWPRPQRGSYRLRRSRGGLFPAGRRLGGSRSRPRQPLEVVVNGGAIEGAPWWRARLAATLGAGPDVPGPPRRQPGARWRPPSGSNWALAAVEGESVEPVAADVSALSQARRRWAECYETLLPIATSRGLEATNWSQCSTSSEGQDDPATREDQRHIRERLG